MKEINKIAVLLTCHNRKEKTLTCLHALFNNALPVGHSLDVFLVDDGSTDGTSQAVRECYPQVNIIKGDGNLYWNRGMHKAWVAAAEAKDYNYYLWLNDDVALLEYALDDVLECASNHPNSIICGTMCSSDSVKPLVTYGGCDASGSLLIPNGIAQKVLGPINGNLVIVAKSVYKKIGMLDPFFSHALGDNEYGYRAHKNDIPVYITKRVLGICDSHEDLPLWCSANIVLLRRLKLFYSPLGCNPFEFFYLEKKQKGLLTATIHFLTLHLRVFFPKFWN